MMPEQKDLEPRQITIPVAIVEKDGKILLLKDCEKLKYEQERYYFPRGRPALGEETIGDLVASLSNTYSLKVEPEEKLGQFKHSDVRIAEFAKFLVFEVFRCQYLDGPCIFSSERWVGEFTPIEEISNLQLDDISSLAWEQVVNHD